MRIFKGRRSANLIDRLKTHTWEHTAERDELLEALVELFAEGGLGLNDLAWMPIDRDMHIRRKGYELIRALNSQQVVAYYLKRWSEILPVARRPLCQAIESITPPGWDGQLAQYLQHRNERTRAAANEMLHYVPITRRIKHQLMKRAEGEEPSERRRAIFRLLDEPEGVSSGLFERSLDDPDDRLRARIIKTLGDTREERFLEVFANRLEVETYSIQQQLIEVLLAYAKEGHDVTSYVLPLMSGGKPALRSTALKILTKMPDQKRVIREFIQYSKAFPGWVRRRALDSMTAFGQLLIEPIMQLLNDPDASIRATAILLATNVKKDEQLENALIPLLDDSDWWVRINAADALGEVGGKTSVPYLLKMLDDPDTRWSALEALARVKEQSCVPSVMALLDEPEPDVRVEVIKALVRFESKKAIERLKQLVKTDPTLEVRHEAYRGVQSLSGERELSEEEEESLKKGMDYIGGMDLESIPPMVRLLLKARELQASDIHISVGRPPMVRARDELIAIEGHDDLTAQDTFDLLRSLLTDAQETTLLKDLSVELCYEIPERGRYRGSIFVDRCGLNAVFRLIPNTVPNFVDIGMPDHVAQIAHWHQGLVLIVGPAGSGKTTTLAALVNLFNETRECHIITIEDPIEFVHHYKSCLINQREIGRDTNSYYRALRGALREDPDIIGLGELRDAESIRLALEAAETGHLVLGTINGTSATRAVDRLINAFPPDQKPQTRMMLSDTLKMVIGQSLLPRSDGQGRAAVFEVLMGSSTVAAVIRENKDFMLPSLMQTGFELGMRTFDDSLGALVDAGKVTPEQAYMRAHKKERFEGMCSSEFLEGVLA